MRTSPKRYRPIRDYAIIGDGRTAALVATDGAIDWCCLPHFDSPAIFCRILDEARGGFFRVGPRDRCGVSRAYVDGTNILATTFVTAGGSARLTDFMPVQMPQSPPSPPCMVRCLEGLAGRVELTLDLLPTFDYGRIDATISLGSGGAVVTTPREFLWLSCPVPVQQTPTGVLTAPLTIGAGERCWVVGLRCWRPHGAIGPGRRSRASAGAHPRTLAGLGRRLYLPGLLPRTRATEYADPQAPNLRAH